MSFFKRRQFLAFTVFCLSSLGVTAGCRSSLMGNNAENPTELTVSAAASLKDVLEAIKPLYLKDNSKVNLTYNFASSGSLQQQIEQGAPVDIFISAAPKQMNALQEKELIQAETRQDLLKNQMVLIVPQDNNKIKGFTDLKTADFDKMALGEPESVPAGKYGQEVLKTLGLFDTVKSKAVYGKDVRQVLNYVATENVDVGIVYRTDVKASDQVKVLETAPENSHSPIIYPVAVVKTSANPEAAKKFINFLQSDTAGNVFENEGFIHLKP